MNVQEINKNPNAKGVTLGPVTVKQAYPREQKDNYKKDGKEWSQGIIASDSTGEIRVYLTEQPEVKKGDTIEIQGVSVKVGAKGPYCSTNYKSKVIQVTAIQRGPEAKPTPVTNEGPRIQSDTSDQTGESIDSKVDRMASIWGKMKQALENASGMRIVDVGELPADAGNAYAQAVATQNQALIASINTLFIQYGRN